MRPTSEGGAHSLTNGIGRVLDRGVIRLAAMGAARSFRLIAIQVNAHIWLRVHCGSLTSRAWCLLYALPMRAVPARKCLCEDALQVAIRDRVAVRVVSTGLTERRRFHLAT